MLSLMADFAEKHRAEFEAQYGVFDEEAFQSLAGKCLEDIATKEDEEDAEDVRIDSTH